MKSSSSLYQFYLHSEQWKAKATECKKLANSKCSKCSATTNLQAHHIRYDNVGNEPQKDLVCLCYKCHAKEHNTAPAINGLYWGPKKYWRVMELYDKAQLLLSSKVGIHIMIYLKTQVNTENYRIHINQSWLAADLGTTPAVINRNLKKLIDNNYIKKEKRGKYFVNPKMFWIANMKPDNWQKLVQEYNDAQY